MLAASGRRGDGSGRGSRGRGASWRLGSLKSSDAVLSSTLGKIHLIRAAPCCHGSVVGAIVALIAGVCVEG